LLEVRLRPGRGDGEDLARQVLAPALGELAALVEVRAVLLDLFPQLGDALPAHGLGQQDRRLPVAIVVERQDRAHLVQHRLRCRMI
jgi:hypothetical protein